MNTHNIGFYEDLTKIIFQISNTHHISASAGNIIFMSYRETTYLLHVDTKRPRSASRSPQSDQRLLDSKIISLATKESSS